MPNASEADQRTRFMLRRQCSQEPCGFSPSTSDSASLPRRQAWRLSRKLGAGQNGGKRGETPETLNVRGGSQAESVARGPLHCGKTARPEEGFSARGKNPMLPSAAIWHPEMMVSSFSQIDPDTAILGSARTTPGCKRGSNGGGIQSRASEFALQGSFHAPARNCSLSSPG